MMLLYTNCTCGLAKNEFRLLKRNFRFGGGAVAAPSKYAHGFHACVIPWLGDNQQRLGVERTNDRYRLCMRMMVSIHA